jgi:hypothetical protein
LFQLTSFGVSFDYQLQKRILALITFITTVANVIVVAQVVFALHLNHVKVDYAHVGFTYFFSLQAHAIFDLNFIFLTYVIAQRFAILNACIEK